MPPRSIRRRSRRGASIHLGRRCGVLALLVVYVLTAAGVPLPMAPVARTSGELYPCASCGCGCSSAEHCWTSCCCHSLAERFAWARRNGVRPPEFAIAQARQAGIDVSWLDGEEGGATPTCCIAKVKSASQTQLACSSPTRSCCSSHKHAAPAHTPADAPANRVDSILVWKALACGGHAQDWLAAVPTMISMGPELSCAVDRVEWLGPPLSEIASGIGRLPATPPPQSA